MRKINPLEKYLLGNVVGFTSLLLASSNETYHWLNPWYSVVGYTIGMVTFIYVILFALPKMRKWMDKK